MIRYDGMTYRRLGKSGLKLPVVSLGLWHNFGGVTTRENARAMLKEALSLGVTHLDAANNYGPPPGSAEETLGALMRQDFAAHRDELVISTKAGYTMWQGPYGDHGSRKYLLASLDQSLKRMGLEYVDIFYHHRPDPETPIEETMGALASAVRSGKALYVGISNYNPEQTAVAVQTLAALGVPCLIHQMRYNMLDRQNEGVFDVLAERGVGSIAFSPLAQGVLTDKYVHGVPEGSRAATTPFLNAERVHKQQDRVRALREIANARGQTLSQMALAWVARRADSVLIGASSPEQIRENCAMQQNLTFTDGELQAIDAACALPLKE